MKKVFRNTRTQCTLWLILTACSIPAAGAGPLGLYQHGTVVRMRMGDCLPGYHGFMVALGGQPAQMPAEVCPEYTLISDKVVFVIVGKSSGQLVPLADIIDFRFRNNQLAVRVDDAQRETRFSIKEMILRSEWDLLQERMQKHIEDQFDGPQSAGTPAATPASQPTAIRQVPTSVP